MRRILLTLTTEAALLALLQHEAGLDAPHVTMLALGALALTAVASAHRTPWATPPAAHPRWPRDRRDRRDGSRDDVASLSWTFFGRDDIVTAQALRSIRTIAATRLHAHGADLHDPHDAPACRHLLGDETYHLLDPTNPTTAPRPTITQLDRIITALENLAPPGTTPQTTSRTPPRTRTTP